MAPIHSFYLPPDMWREPYQLSGDEAHHLCRVLRLRPGATVRLFDGKGTYALFTVTDAQKFCVTLTLDGDMLHKPSPATRCTLAAGFSKALRRGWFLEKAVELEADALWFWQGDYSQAKLPSSEKQSWQASLVAGAKQCENPRLPGLSMLPGGVEDIVGRLGEFDHAFVLYEGDTQGRLLTREEISRPGSLLLIVGPEGGFSPRETALLQEAGVPHVSLGDSILRWETAAVLILGMAWWARQS